MHFWPKDRGGQRARLWALTRLGCHLRLKASQEAGTSGPTTTRNQILPTTGMNLEADFPSEPQTRMQSECQLDFSLVYSNQSPAMLYWNPDLQNYEGQYMGVVLSR